MRIITKRFADRARRRDTAAGLLLCLGGAAIIVPAAAQQQQVGTAAAVNPASLARTAGGGTRTIVLGESIAHKERIQTTAAGTVQLLFLDKTSMTIGPNSDVTIDEYVYDPQANTGKLAASLAKGVMRFVGGQISHNGEAQIATANAVVGIRGGVGIISNANVYAGYGSLFVTTNGGSVTLGAGEFTTTQFDGPPTPPGAPPENFISNMVRLFQSVAGQTGGTPVGHASAKNVNAAENRTTGGGNVAGGPPTNANPPPPPTNTNNNLNQTIQSVNAQNGITSAIENQPYRPTTTLIGFVGGLMTSTPGEGSSTTGFTGVSQVSLDSQNNRVQATFAGANYPREGDAPYSPSSGVFVFGHPGGESTYKDYGNFSASASYADGQPVSMIDGAPITNHTATMTTVSDSQARQLAANTGVQNLTLCQCEYTRWGFWSSQNQRDAGGRNYTDTVQYGTWVAGRPAQSSDMPTTGSATYIGHVFAAIQDQNQQRLAAGNLVGNVDFGQRNASINVTNLDQTNYSGGITFVGNTPQFGGVLQGNVGDRSMTMVGSLMQGKTSPIGEMGGSVSITGTNYLGSGIFAAAKR